MIFTSFGYSVQLYDTNKECLDKAKNLIGDELKGLCSKGLARGSLSYDERMSLITTTSSLQELLTDVWHLQECVFDNLNLKQGIFEEVDKLIGDDNKLASISTSSSVHMPSLVFSKVKKHREQCLNAHPINPPIHVRLVELIPLPETRTDILSRVRTFMQQVGQKPVVLNKEISGFALNRIQYACLQEAYRLVHDGVMSPEDADTVVSDGLGPRYAFMGPWMTAHLNAPEGLEDYLQRYNEGIYNVSQECKPLLKFGGETAQKFIDSMRKLTPIEKLPDKRAWRDSCLNQLAQIKDKNGDGTD